MTTLGMALSQLGRWEEALVATAEAVEIRRLLARANSAYFESDLARELWSFAGIRVDGQIELPQALTAAEESIVIYGHLMQRQPEVFASELRGALATLADVLNSLGRSDEVADIRHRIDQLPGAELKTASLGPRTPKVSLFRRWLRRA